MPVLQPDVIIFDLDNTLYPRQSGLLNYLDQRINEYLERRLRMERKAVDELRRRYVETYGTTLRGIQINHGVDPLEYIAATHSLDARQFIRPEQDVNRAIRSLACRKAIMTNSPRMHVNNVLGALELTDAFDKIYTIESVGYEGKPNRTAYEKVLTDLGVEASQCAMVEDTTVNLVEPHELGMITVLISDDLDLKQDHVDLLISDITQLPALFACDGHGVTRD